jgi:hypothetical protein
MEIYACMRCRTPDGTVFEWADAVAAVFSGELDPDEVVVDVAIVGVADDT